LALVLELIVTLLVVMADKEELDIDAECDGVGSFLL
jgi:hypothetical protein